MQRRKTLPGRLLDFLLLPFALVVVVVEDVLWEAAGAILRRLAGLAPVRAAQAWLAGLPAVAVLPLFLVPEAISHLAGLAATILLARGNFLASAALVVLVKGLATLAVVWIYQAAAPTLLSVRWFANLHRWVISFRTWSLARVLPLVHAIRQALYDQTQGSFAMLAPVMRRFRTLRRYLASLRQRL